MAVEARRGCGYRKIGGTYLCADGSSFPCGRFPIPLRPCPLCEHQPAFTRGLQRIRPAEVLHSAPPCRNPDGCARCPLGKVGEQDIAGLMWVGERFYSPYSFALEAERLGVSKRIAGKTIPGWLTIGETWVFFAHESGFVAPCPSCGEDPRRAGGTEAGLVELFSICGTCEGLQEILSPGVFFACRPTRIERIIGDDMPEDEREQLRDAGYTLVEVPADDPDHRGKADD